MLWRLNQADVVKRRFLDPEHRAYIPDWGVFLVEYGADAAPSYHSLSRQMVLFCVERRKAWRMLQSRAGVENKDYLAQRQILQGLEDGQVDRERFMEDSQSLVAEARG